MLEFNERLVESPDFAPRFGNLTYTTGSTTYNLVPLVVLVVGFFLFRIVSLLGITGAIDATSGYGAPSSGYGAPSASYGAPAPAASYGAPAPSYGAPSTGYNAGAGGGAFYAKVGDQYYNILQSGYQGSNNPNILQPTESNPYLAEGESPYFFLGEEDLVRKLFDTNYLMGGTNVNDMAYNPYVNTYQWQQKRKKK